MQIVFPNNSFQRNTQMHSQKKLEKQNMRMLRNQEEAKACNRTATRTMRAVQLLTSAPHPHKNKRNKSIITKIPHTSENGSLQKKKKSIKALSNWHVFGIVQEIKSHAVQSQTIVMQLMQLCTYSGQLQVNLWLSGRRAQCLWHKCGRRKTWTGHKQDQDTAREQHDMHFTDLTLHEL